MTDQSIEYRRQFFQVTDEPEQLRQLLVEIARHAAEVIQERGKARRSYMSADGRVCTLGALRVASYEVRTQSTWVQDIMPPLAATDAFAESDLTDRIGRITGWHSVSAWNDECPEADEKIIAKTFMQVADELAVLEVGE